MRKSWVFYPENIDIYSDIMLYFSTQNIHYKYYIMTITLNKDAFSDSIFCIYAFTTSTLTYYRHTYVQHLCPAEYVIAPIYYNGGMSFFLWKGLYVRAVVGLLDY